MTKQNFLDKLRTKLKALPKKEVEECLSFYSEMIDDRIEEGLSECDAVSAVGDVNKITKEKLGEEISEKLAQGAKKKNDKRDYGKLALIIAGSPLWAPLAIAALTIIFSLYASAWAIIASFWSAFAAFAVSVPAGLILSMALFFNDLSLAAAISISAALVSFSLAIFSFFGCLWLTKKLTALSVISAKYVKTLFTKKETRK